MKIKEIKRRRGNRRQFRLPSNQQQKYKDEIIEFKKYFEYRWFSVPDKKVSIQLCNSTTLLFSPQIGTCVCFRLFNNAYSKLDGTTEVSSILIKCSSSSVFRGFNQLISSAISERLQTQRYRIVIHVIFSYLTFRR
jgi:hypothetical protein